jgi:hypothetical protein
VNHTNSAGVSTIDISLIRRHILNIAGARFDSPYKLLSADVNNSRTVTTLDISWIRKMVLGATNSFPGGVWRFVPSDYVFPDPDAPWDAPSNRVYNALGSALTAQNFYAIKLGDVNYNWAPAAGASLMASGGSPVPMSAALPGPTDPNAPHVLFRVSCHTNEPSQPISAQIRVVGFSNVTSAQFTLEWDPYILSYREVSKFALSGMSVGNFGTNLVGSGTLTFSWDDPSAAQGITLADDTAIFTVGFDTVGQPATRSHLLLSDSATPREVAIGFTPAVFDSESGQVLLAGQAPAPQIAGAVFADGEFSLSFGTVRGKNYILEYTDSLSDSEWHALPAVMGDGTVKTLSDPSPDSQQRFYRIRIE